MNDTFNITFKIIDALNELFGIRLVGAKPLSEPMMEYY